MVEAWDAAGSGEIDLLDWFSELTIYTSSTCLIGRKFRLQLDDRFGHLYHALEQGTDALAFVDAYADIPSFRARDEARLGLVALIQAIMDERRADTTPDRARGPGPARRAHVDRRRRRRPPLRRRHGHRHVHLHDVRRAPHHLGHRGVDAHRAAAPPRGDGGGGRRARRALRRRRRGQLPGAAVDAPAGGRHQGGAAPAPAADPAAAGGQRRPRRGRPPHRRRQDGRRQPGRLEPPARGVRRRRRLPARSLPRGPGRRRRQPVELDPLRRRPPPLRGRPVRHDAAQGHLLGAAQGLDHRGRAAARQLPQRPLQDGRAAGPALPGHLPPAHAGRRRHHGCRPRPPGQAADRRTPAAEPAQTRTTGWRIAVDRDLCQGHAVCEGEAPELFSVTKQGRPHRPATSVPPDDARAARKRRVDATCPTHALSHRSKHDQKERTDGWLPPSRAGRDGRALAPGQPRRRGGRRLGADARRPVHRGRHLRLELRAQGELHGRGPRRDPRHRPRPGDGRPRRLGVPVPGDRDRRGQGPRRRLLAPDRRRHPRGRHPLRGGRHRRQLVPLRRQLPVVLAARLVRLRQRRVGLPGDDHRRQALRGHDRAHEPVAEARPAPGPLPPRRHPGGPLGRARRERLLHRRARRQPDRRRSWSRRRRAAAPSRP